MSWYIYTSLTVSITAIAGNGFVIWLITTKSKLHNTTNWFILSLAVSDLMVGLFITPLHIACKELETCDIYLKSVFEELFLYESIFNLSAMTVDRYVAIVHPLKYASYMTTSGAVKTMAISWGIPLVNFGLHFSWLYAEPATRAKWFRIFTIMETIVMVAIPCILLMVANIQIIRVARLHSKRAIAQLHHINFNKMGDNSTEHANRAAYEDSERQTNVTTASHPLSDKPSSSLRVRSERRSMSKKFRRMFQRRRSKRSSVRVIIAVITIFLFCWSLSLYASFCTYLGMCSVSLTLSRVTWLFMILNPAINPLVLILFKSDLRAEFATSICMATLKRTLSTNKENSIHGNMK